MTRHLRLVTSTPPQPDKQTAAPATSEGVQDVGGADHGTAPPTLHPSVRAIREGTATAFDEFIVDVFGGGRR